MSDDKKTQETVREMARLALLSGRISEVQEKNLKLYPFVFFNGVLSATVDYDFSRLDGIFEQKDEKKLLEKEDTKAADAIKYKLEKPESRHFSVSYSLAIDETKENDQLDRRFEMLTKAIRALFWNETKIKVYFNGQLKYESKNV